MSALYAEDVLDLSDALSPEEQATLRDLREHIETTYLPVLAEHWERGEFPEAVIPGLLERNLMHPPALSRAEPSARYHGFRNYELARADASLATFYNAQSGLFRSTVMLGGSAEQRATLGPKIEDFSYRGVFCLTEPEHGSDIAGGLATTARRDGDEWVIDGEKRWIGGADRADVLCVFARDVDDQQVKAFLVPSRAPGVTMTKITGKVALRCMQNFDITFENVRVDESDRLQGINNFSDVANCLKAMRSDVAWIATGVAAGAFNAALRYTADRQQFGSALGGFQLIQEKLARMSANVTSSLALVDALTQKQERGDVQARDSALAKLQTCLLMRETVALAREVCGGNGITLQADVARFFADAEAVYSYEGTHEINALIVGRALTGIGAFRAPGATRGTPK